MFKLWQNMNNNKCAVVRKKIANKREEKGTELMMFLICYTIFTMMKSEVENSKSHYILTQWESPESNEYL